MNIQEAYNLFLRDCRDPVNGKLSDSTITNYKTSLNYYFKKMNIMNIKQINQSTLHAFFRWGITEQNWKPSTEATHRKCINKFIKWAIENNHMHNNPLDKIKYPRIIENIPDFYTEEELSKIMYYTSVMAHNSFLKARNEAVIAIFVMAGLRRSELTSLTMRDVDIEGMRIEVRGETAKNKHPRVISMSYRLQDYLKKYLEAREELGINIFELWASERNKPFTNAGLKHLFDQLTQKVGFAVGAQKMRRTAATGFYRGKKDIMATKSFLGHKKVQTTMRYANVTAEDMVEAVESNPFNSIF